MKLIHGLKSTPLHAYKTMYVQYYYNYNNLKVDTLINTSVFCSDRSKGPDYETTKPNHKIRHAHR